MYQPIKETGEFIMVFSTNFCCQCGRKATHSRNEKAIMFYCERHGK